MGLHAEFSVADPDSVLFLPPGSEMIRDPDPGWSNGRIRDKTSRIRNTDAGISFFHGDCSKGEKSRRVVTLFIF
jgi:hypothetical protein